MKQAPSHTLRHIANRPSWAMVALMLVLAACGGAEEAATESGGADVAPEGNGTSADGEELSADMEAAVAEAEGLGLEFITDHEDIVACAREEGALTAASSHDEEYELIASFEEQYPFIDVTLADFSGNEARERFVLEVEAGAVPPYDVLSVPANMRTDLLPLVKSYDVLGMAEAGILDIPIEMIDKQSRTVVASGSTAGVFAYNQNSFADMELPTTWEELLEPRFHSSTGFRMLSDTRSQNAVPLVAAWGLERTVEYYRDLGAQDPTWVADFSAHLVQMAQGESDAYPFTNLHSAHQQVTLYGDPLKYAFLEPIPIRLSEEHAVANFDIAENPCAGLLFVEWTGTPAGQEAWEIGGQRYQSSIFSEYEGGLADLVEDTGLETSIAGWDLMLEAEENQAAILEAAGLPSAER